MEALEHVPQVVLRDADTVVLDRDEYPATRTDRNCVLLAYRVPAASGVGAGAREVPGR
jgi:hypothetical protein